MDGVKEIDGCKGCDVLAPLSASGGNEWVRGCRVASAAIPGRHKKEFIHEALQSVYNSQDKTFGVITVNERQCCLTCFKCAYGFDKSVFSEAKICVENGEPSVQVTSESLKREMSKEQTAIDWCRHKYLLDIGNRDPCSGHIMVEKPDRLDWYSEFRMDQLARLSGTTEDPDKKIARPRTFFRGMVAARENCDPPIMHRKHLPFARCAQCHAFKCELMRAHSGRERDEIRMKRKQHLENQYAERQAYYDKREKAMKRPDKYMSMIIDGMDQAKLDMPHFARASKGNAKPLGNSLIGVLVHGVEFKQFLVSHAMKGGGNEMMTVLTTTIIELQEDYRSAGKKWPDVLYLQLDNTCKDNKNKALMTYLSELVKMGVFKKVKCSFLYVGHTHEDIDQRFSVISRFLMDNDVLTMEDFLSELRKLNNNDKEKKVTARALDWVYDYSEWARDVVDSRFSQFMKHHVFRFKIVRCATVNEHGQEEISNEVRMHVKEWARKKDGAHFPYVPDLQKDRVYGYKVVNLRDSKGGLARYQEKNKIGIAPFDGKLDRDSVSAILKNVKALARQAPRTWKVPPHCPPEESPLVASWDLYLSSIPLSAEDVEDIGYSSSRPRFFPWPKPVEQEAAQEVRPELRIEALPLARQIQGSRPEGVGAVVVRGPTTGQGLESAAVEHEAAVAKSRADRAIQIARATPEAGQGEGAQGGGEEEDVLAEQEDRPEEAAAPVEATPVRQEEDGIEAVIAASNKKNGEGRFYQVLWENNEETEEPELGNDFEDPLVGIDPCHIYGTCFGEENGMLGRRIVFEFMKGTKSNLQEEERLDPNGGRMHNMKCECVVRQVLQSSVEVAWEVAGTEEDEWDNDVEHVQLHSLEKGTEWKMLNCERNKGGTRVKYVHGKVVVDEGRRGRGRRGT